MAEIQEATTNKGPAPPYIAFQSLKTFSKILKEHGLPGRIDRSVLSNFSGAVGGQLITALKFLRLTDDECRPTELMKKLVDSYDTDQWPKELAAVVENAYRPIFELDLERASPAQFNEAFRAAYPGADDVVRKSKTFFLNAVRDTPIKVSTYILKTNKPRTLIIKPRPKILMKPKPNKSNGSTTVASDLHANSDASTTQMNGIAVPSKPTSQIVFEVFDPISMPPDVQQATLTLLTYLKANGK